MPDQTVMTPTRRTELEKTARDLAALAHIGGLSPVERAVVDAVAWIGVLEQRNHDLGTAYAQMEKYEDIVKALQRQVRGLRQAVKVAEGGLLVGEVTAMKAIVGDLETVLTHPEEVN